MSRKLPLTYGYTKKYIYIQKYKKKLEWKKKKGNKKTGGGGGGIQTVGNGFGVLEIRTRNCSSGYPYNHFAAIFSPKTTNCTESVCAEPLFLIPACETKICAKNSDISRLWLVEIGDRGALVDGSITQSNKITQLTTRSPSSLQDHPAHYKITQLTTRSPSSLQDHPALYKSLALPPWTPHNSWVPYIDGHVDYLSYSITEGRLGWNLQINRTTEWWENYPCCVCVFGLDACCFPFFLPVFIHFTLLAFVFWLLSFFLFLYLSFFCVFYQTTNRRIRLKRKVPDSSINRPHTQS